MQRPVEQYSESAWSRRRCLALEWRHALKCSTADSLLFLVLGSYRPACKDEAKPTVGMSRQDMQSYLARPWLVWRVLAHAGAAIEPTVKFSSRKIPCSVWLSCAPYLLVCSLAFAVVGAVDIHGIISRSVGRRALFSTEMSIDRGLSIRGSRSCGSFFSDLLLVLLERCCAGDDIGEEFEVLDAGYGVCCEIIR